MKHKLVLIFNDGLEVTGIDKVLIFNNELDAQTFLLSTNLITNLKIEIEDNWFSYKTNDWSGHGKAYWTVDKS